MFKQIQQRALIAVFCVISLSCKKDIAPVTPPPQPAPIPINDIVETEPGILTPIVNRINAVTYGLYSAVPALYHKTTRHYPLIIFIPGAGQLGKTEGELSYLLNDGMAKLFFEKRFPPNFKVNGMNYSFIVLTPQFSQVPTIEELMDFVRYAKKNYRVDTNRVYLSGLSMGGIATTNLAAANPSLFAAIVPIAGVTTEAVPKKTEQIAKGNTPVWIFHNEKDPQVSVIIPNYFFDELTKWKPPVAPKLTIFKVYGHNAWEEALSPAYKENNLNIYEWMLQYSR